MKGKNFWTCLAILQVFPGFFEIAFKNQKANLDFQWIFDNPLAKYLISEVSWMNGLYI